jgi:uncharacterized membrane-anchored protein
MKARPSPLDGGPRVSLVWILCALALQLTVLVGELARAHSPRWTGEPVALAVRPVDPRSPFRGDYARLALPDVATLDWSLFPDDVVAVRRGQPLWVVLEDRGSTHKPVRVSTTRPTGELALRGRAQHEARRQWGAVGVRYGLEAFFAAPERAQELERRMRRGEKATARVYVSPSGRAALVDVVFGER